MAAKSSSFLPHLSFSRGDSSLLPLHTNSRHPLRTKPSEYDLDELSPQAEDALLSPEIEPTRFRSSASPRRHSPPRDATDRGSTPVSASRMKPTVLFAGPPPPIATSTLLYRDVEDRGASSPRGWGESLAASSSVRTAIGSVLFDRSATNPKERHPSYDPDSIWRSLQRREKAIQNELQQLLDIQAAGLSAGLGRPLNPSPGPGSSGPASDAGTGGSSTPTGTFYTGRSSLRLPTDRSTATGEVIPVRQPRPRKMGLRAARTGLARSMALLADLKAEEDTSLAAALSARKHALAQLRRLAGRRDGIAGELRSLEEDDEEPLARELRELSAEHGAVSAQISEMEERLAGLRNRRRVLESRIEDVNNQREAGLSGYRGALREVEGQVAALLRRPPVKPLDLEALPTKSGPGGSETAAADGENQGPATAAADPSSSSPGGVEFLRLRPERRTAGMAKDWWEGEVGILEERKAEVDKEREALEQGAEVWKEAIQLVSDFEADLRKQMTSGVDGEGEEVDGSTTTTKGKGKLPTPEERMLSQLGKLGGVIAGLEQRMQIVEDKGWNLLICAIGAELEAFREAEQMLRDALRAAGVDPGDDVVTPRLARSASDTQTATAARVNGRREGDTLVDTQDDRGAESDNEVPPDLLVTHHDEEEQDGDDDHHHDDRDSRAQGGYRPDSEDEVPPEFLAEHRADDHETG